MLYQLRYRQQHSILDTMIEASSDDLAVAVGRAWCEKNSSPAGSVGQKKIYISIQAAVVADESILATMPAAVSEEKDWMLMTAIERLAKSTGRTEEEVRAELRAKKKPQPPKVTIEEQPAGILSDARAKLREMAGIK